LYLESEKARKMKTSLEGMEENKNLARGGMPIKKNGRSAPPFEVQKWK
jgi:hypothetical protein